MTSKKTPKQFTYALGEIVETIFIDGDLDEETFDHLINFSIDPKGRTRLSRGLVNMIPENEDNMNYVPSTRFEIEENVWNSHQQYVQITLPSPALDYEYYKMIRSAFLTEMQKRLPSLTPELPKSVTSVLGGP